MSKPEKTKPLARQHQDVTISYRLNGEDHEWCISAMASETEDDIRAHLKKWKPNAEFLSIKRENR